MVLKSLRMEEKILKSGEIQTISDIGWRQHLDLMLAIPFLNWAKHIPCKYDPKTILICDGYGSKSNMIVQVGIIE